MLRDWIPENKIVFYGLCRNKNPSAINLLEQNLYKTIAQAYANARAALNKYNANKLSVEANEVSFNFAQQKYNVGSLSSFDYNSAKTRLQTALGNLVQAKYDYVFKLKVLDYYQGKPITF